MRRIAAHALFVGTKSFRYAYVEWKEDRVFSGYFPLVEEIAGTEFYDGILLPLPLAVTSSVLNEQLQLLQQRGEEITAAALAALLAPYWDAEVSLIGKPVRLFLLNRHQYSSTEF